MYLCPFCSSFVVVSVGFLLLLFLSSSYALYAPLCFDYYCVSFLFVGLLWWQTIKTPPVMQENWVRSLVWKDPLEEGMATHSSILAGESLWTEESGGVQLMWSQRVRHNRVTKNSTCLLQTFSLWLPWGYIWKSIFLCEYFKLMVS